MDYKKYVGKYVKRFYTPFLKENIFTIKQFKQDESEFGMFLYDDGTNQWWSDVEDSVIITDEQPMITDIRVANVNHPDYNGYNPFELHF